MHSQEQNADGIRDVELIDDGNLCTRVFNVAFSAKLIMPRTSRVEQPGRKRDITQGWKVASRLITAWLDIYRSGILLFLRQWNISYSSPSKTARLQCQRLSKRTEKEQYGGRNGRCQEKRSRSQGVYNSTESHK